MKPKSIISKIVTFLVCCLLAAAMFFLLKEYRAHTLTETETLKARAAEAKENDGEASFVENITSEAASQSGVDSASAVSPTEISTASDAANAAAGTYSAISIRGDSYNTSSDNEADGYPAKLAALLQAAGINIAVKDNTWDMAGTLSQMALAGVDDTQIQAFIDEHVQAEEASGSDISVYEKVVRDDLADYKTERDDTGDLPVICMGYYGGYNYQVSELIDQIRLVLGTYTNGASDYLVLGSYPRADEDHAAYDAAMEQAFGDHYVSLNQATDQMLLSDAGRQGIADAIFQKLKDLGYINVQ
jgi:hypothetical protein